MITGRVTPQREATFSLTVIAPDDRERQVGVVLDTGFNGYLTLSSGVVWALRLPLAGNRRVTLGDGSAVVLDMYMGRVRWHEHEREILILQADGDPVGGMALLDGNRVTLDVVDDGDLLIEPLL
jgi:clan AA aspartic protease